MFTEVKTKHYIYIAQVCLLRDANLANMNFSWVINLSSIV